MYINSFKKQTEYIKPKWTPIKNITFGNNELNNRIQMFSVTQPH